jgi:hypothetical protein
VLNRKKLVQLSISEIPSETEYLDYKQQINLSSEQSRGKLIKLICAMNNSNPNGMSFIIIGVRDDKILIGVPFLDDANFQNAVKGFITDCPKLSYENIKFEELPSGDFIGVISIYPNGIGSNISKRIWKLKEGDKYVRCGSTTGRFTQINNFSINQNEFESTQLIQRATVSLQSTLDAVLAFHNETDKAYNPQHLVFNDQHVVGISAYKDEYTDLWSEVTVSLINEEVSYFWSAGKFVKIICLEHCVLIEEQALLFWRGERKFIPFKQTKIDFTDVGAYKVHKELFLAVPTLTGEEIHNFINCYSEKLNSDSLYIEIFPYELLFAALNGSNEATTLLFNRNDGNVDGALAQSYMEAISTYEQFKDGGLFHS